MSHILFQCILDSNVYEYNPPKQLEMLYCKAKHIWYAIEYIW